MRKQQQQTIYPLPPGRTWVWKNEKTGEEEIVVSGTREGASSQLKKVLYARKHLGVDDVLINWKIKSEQG